MHLFKVIRYAFKGMQVLFLLITAFTAFRFSRIPTQETITKKIDGGVSTFSMSIPRPYLELSNYPKKNQFIEVLEVQQENLIISPATFNANIPITGMHKFCLISFFVVLSAIGILLLRQFELIVKNIANGESFSISTINRIITIAIVFIAAPIMEWGMNQLLISYFTEHYSHPDFSYAANTTLGFPVLIIGLLFFVLSVAFRQGVRLQEENALTV